MWGTSQAISDSDFKAGRTVMLQEYHLPPESRKKNEIILEDGHIKFWIEKEKEIY